MKDAKAINNNSSNSNNNNNDNISNTDGWRIGRPSQFNDATGYVNSNSNLHTGKANTSIGVGVNTGEHADLPSTLLSSQSQSQSQPQYSGNSSNSNSTSSSSSVSSGLTSRDSYRITSADNALLYNSAIGLRNDNENGNDEDDLMNFLLDDTNF